MLLRRRYGDGTLRLTVEQNVLFPNIQEDRLDEMRQVRPWLQQGVGVSRAAAEAFCQHSCDLLVPQPFL